MNGHDRSVLRELGSMIHEIASDPVNEERKVLWKRLNSLERVRPPIIIYEIPWNEMEYQGELAVVCEDPAVQDLETNLRRVIYQWRHMPADMVVEDFIAVPRVIHDTGIGLQEEVDIARTDETSTVVSRHFHVQISTDADIEKIKMPVITVDDEATSRRYEMLGEIFDGVIPVRITGWKWTSVAPWDELVRFTGVSEILMDMVTRPAYVHRLIGRMTDAYLSRLDQLERGALLDMNNDTTCLGGGPQYTDELPSPGYNPVRVRPLDMWGRTMSQIFSSVSPAMHEEFALQYERKYLDQFGLTYYGCCEPLHRKIGILRQVKNLRKISMSPWVDADEGAGAIGRDYVYSMKPNPAFLAGDTWDPDVVRKDLTENLRKTRTCAVEIVLKDISTVHYAPQRLWEWARIARDAAAAAG